MSEKTTDYVQVWYVWLIFYSKPGLVCLVHDQLAPDSLPPHSCPSSRLLLCHFPGNTLIVTQVSFWIFNREEEDENIATTTLTNFFAELNHSKKII